MRKRAVQMHGSMIWVEKKPHGRGSVIHLCVPIDEGPSMEYRMPVEAFVCRIGEH